MNAARMVAALAVVVASLTWTGAASAATCGGLLTALFPAYCQPQSAPRAPDPGGAESPDQPVPAAGKHFGFNAALFLSDQATVDQELDAALAAGADTYRFPVTWRVMQPHRSDPPVPDPAPGNLVEKLDAFYAGAIARGIRPIFITHWAPVWATKYRSCFLLDLGCHAIARSSHKLVPDGGHLDEYEAFVRAVKARWPEALIEPWNTPNLYWNHRSFRGSRDFSASPEHFADIQCAAHRASKSVNDDPVLAAGWAASNYLRYVKRVYAAHGDDCWDIANAHVYPGDETDHGEGTVLARFFQDVRQLRDEYGDEDPIWLTETGYTTTGRHRVTAASQEDASRRLYNRLVTMPDVDAVLFHTLRDSPLPMRPYNDRDHSEYGYGFLREDWQPKPVYCHFVAQAGNQAEGC